MQKVVCVSSEMIATVSPVNIVGVYAVVCFLIIEEKNRNYKPKMYHY